jgi:hypothetical protein
MARLAPRFKVLASLTKFDTNMQIHTTYYTSKGSYYMSSTHTLHDFVLSHGSKLVMATTTTSTTDT